MLSIGEFSNICKVSTKTLRYYAEIDLLLPSEINPENGYRYYSIHQLETMLFISRLKSYGFCLEEIKEILKAKGSQEEVLCMALTRKKEELEKKRKDLDQTMLQMNQDIITLQQGKSIMSYLDEIEVSLVEVSAMNVLSMRLMVREGEFPQAYRDCFGNLFKRIAQERLTIAGAPMVMFHTAEFTPCGMDSEFAVPIEEQTTKTRLFQPKLCLKTRLHGSYANLPSVYAKQMEWAEKEGYETCDALYEVYINDPSEIQTEQELITEIYYPVRKRGKK